MRNLRKLLAVLVAVVIVVTTMVPAFAAESYTYTDQAKKLYDMGLFQGLSNTGFEPGLGLALDRQTGTVMLLRLLGQEAAANAMTDADATAALAKFTDKGDIADWAKKSVAYAVKNNLVQGVADTVVGPKLNLTGKMYATMILRNLGYKVEGAAYDTACATLADKGGLTPTQALQFNEKALIRDDLVGVSFGVLAAKYSDGTVVIDKLVADKVVAADKAIAAGVFASITALANPADITVTVGGTVTLPTTVKATMSDSSTKDVAVTWDKTVDNTKAATTTLTGTVVNSTLTASLKVIVNAKPIAVESVTQLNASQIKVVFNNEVDKVSAQTIGNYYVNGLAIAGSTVFGASTAAALAADNKTVTITAGTSYLANNVSFTFKVSNVLSKSYALVPEYTTVITGADTTAPSLVSATAKAGAAGTTTVTVTLNEPVSRGFVGTYKVSGISATASADKATITLTTGQTLMPDTTYTLSIVGVSDGINTTSSITQDFTVVNDNTVPQIVSVTQKYGYVAVAFDKVVATNTNLTLLSASPSGTTNGDFSIYRTGDQTNYASGPIIRDAEDSTNKTILITVSPAIYGATGGTTATAELILKNLKDNNNNVMVGTYTSALSLVKDSIKPTLVSAVLNTANNQEIFLTFSEPVSRPGALSTITVLKNATAYDVSATYANGSTSLVTAAGVAAAAGTVTSKYIKYTLVAALATGSDYSFTVPSGMWQDNVTNTSDSMSFTVSPIATADAAKPFVTNIASALNGNNQNTITVNFNEKVNLADAINVSNYVIDGAAIPTDAVITNVSATPDDAKDFVITFTKASVDNNNATVTGVLTIANIRDTNGNVMNTFNSTIGSGTVNGVDYTAATRKSITLVDTKAPVLVSASATAYNKVELIFSENIAAVLNPGGANDIVVTDGTTTQPFDIADVNTVVVYVGTKVIVSNTNARMGNINFANARIEYAAGLVQDQSVANNTNVAKVAADRIAIADKFVNPYTISSVAVSIYDRGSSLVAGTDVDTSAEIGMEFTEQATAINDGIVTYKIYFVPVTGTSPALTTTSGLANYVPVLTLNRGQILSYPDVNLATTLAAAIPSAILSFSDGTVVRTFNGTLGIVVTATDAAGNSNVVFTDMTVAGAGGTAMNIAD